MKKLYYYYDKEADIFYISKGKPLARVSSQETGDDVILRLHPKTKEVVGFTVLNFVKRLGQKSASIPLPIQLEFAPLK